MKTQKLIRLILVVVGLMIGLCATAQLVDQKTFDQKRAKAWSYGKVRQNAAATEPSAITITQNPFEIDAIVVDPGNSSFEVKIYFNTAVMAAYRSECCPRVAEFQMVLPTGFDVTAVTRGGDLQYTLNGTTFTPISVSGNFNDETNTLRLLGYGMCGLSELSYLPTGRIHYATISIQATNAQSGNYNMMMSKVCFGLVDEPSEFKVSGSHSFDLIVAQKATGITLNQSSLELNVGNTAQLTATITPANTTDKRIIWTSSSPNTASVSSNGLVTANGNGQCLITATTLDGTNLSASCIVTVNGGGGGGVVADNYLSAADIEEVVAGQSFVIPIALTNQDPITAIQADMYLPNGVIVPDYNDDDEFVVLEPSRMGRGHSVATTVTQISTRILVSSSRNAAFQGNEGTVMYIYLKMAENAGVGIYGIDLKNIRLTTTSGQLINAPDVVISVGAVAYHGGDANGDGYVDDTDYAITVNYLLGQTSSDFKFEAADMSGDGYVLVNDLPMIIDAALAYDFGASNAPRRDLLKAAANNKMYVSDFDLGGNATKTLNILLNNATAFAAVQCDIELPTGLSIVEQTDEWGDLAYALPVAARFNGHESWTDLTGLGDVRLIIASSSNKSLRSTSGAVATFKVRSAAGFSGEHELVLKNIVCADANAVRYALPDAVCLINHAANLPGDIDGNGAVNGTDLNILINIILGKDNAANYGGRANVNGEGGVDGNDLNKLINIILGK